jgi:hypothetical protein
MCHRKRAIGPVARITKSMQTGSEYVILHLSTFLSEWSVQLLFLGATPF